MKNITLSADEKVIQLARQKAKSENTSLNVRFREWLGSYASQGEPVTDLNTVLERLKYAKAGRKFTREEMNER